MADKLTRRDFLKLFFVAGVGLAIGSLPIAPAIVRRPELSDYTDADPSPVLSQKAVVEKDWHYAGRIFDAQLGSTPLKFFGVAHTRRFAEENYDRLDDLVKRSSVVVSEINPRDFSDPGVYNNPKSYFGTVANLCQKHGKPLVSLDPASEDALGVDFYQSILAGVTLIGLNTAILGQRPLTRRKLLGFTAAAAIGSFLSFSGGLFTEPIEDLMASAQNPRNTDEWLDARFGHSQYYLNHEIDQRNLEITERLLALPAKLSAKELTGGDYILAEFGAAHAVGVEYYLKHPVMRRLKSAIYAVSYGLIDNDEMLKFVPDGKGHWNVEELK